MLMWDLASGEGRTTMERECTKNPDNVVLSDPEGYSAMIGVMFSNSLAILWTQSKMAVLYNNHFITSTRGTITKAENLVTSVS